MVRNGLMALACLAAGLFINHYVPLQVGVVVLYLGIGAVAIGGLALIRPLRSIGLRRRLVAGTLTSIGAILVTAAMLWPAPVIRATGPHQRLDDFMSSYSFYERHETRVKATPDQVARAVRTVRFSDMPVAGLLMRIRGMASGRFNAPPPSPAPILEVLSRPGTGFLTLDGAAAGEYVGGMVGRPWASGRPPRVTTPSEFLSFTQPGMIKVAFNMRWVDEGNGYVRLTTETRCAGTDSESERIFARYWRVIYPGSAIIRRVWLDAIARLAQQS
jgi:hypothetical protein